MKYFNIKRYKFSTITKNLRVLFVKSFNTLNNVFLKTFRFANFGRYDLKKFYKYLDIRNYDFTKISKFFEKKTYSINRLKKKSFISSKFLILHLPASIIFFGFLYLFIPTFYSYDKADIKKVICEKKNIECLIKGKVNYSFYPTPRIKIKDLIIRDSSKKKNTIITVSDAAIKISFKNLLAKEKHQFKSIKLNNFKINFNLKSLEKYKNIFKKKINHIPITFVKGQIIFFDGEDYVGTISEANINIKITQGSIDSILKGQFLNDQIYFNLNSKKIDNKISTDVIIKMSGMNFLTKANFINSEKDKNIMNGNFLIKKSKNRIAGVFSYKDKQITINKSNLKNTFLDGKLEGKITLLPYFDFNLDLNLNSLNFTKLYNQFLNFDQNAQKSLFNIDKKINGKLNLSSEKIYSNYNLIKSLESRLKFYNGNVSIEQLLLNFGKLGAADMLGTIRSDKKFTNFKFESNIFVDNEKKFLSKFGIYNKKNLPTNLFVSGNFDLEKIKMSFYELSGNEKLNSDDITYIEEEFNDLMLEDGYGKLFHFAKFKEFIKLITAEND